MRPVLVALHAHPDDEAIFTGGTIVRAVRAGWRVVLVVATSGEAGLGGESPGALGARRRAETERSAAILGIERVEFLGYHDSGCDEGASKFGTEHHSDALAAADLATAVRSVRSIIEDEGAAVVTSYDEIGIYGHIDHVRVHEIGVRAVRGTSCELYEATLSRAALRELREELLARGLHDERWPRPLIDQLGLEDDALVAIDVTAELPEKRAAIAAHASQVVDAQSFMGLPPGAFHRLLGTEWFRPVQRGSDRFLEIAGVHGDASIAARI